MKRAGMLILALLLPFAAQAQDWTDADTAREAVYLAFHVTDWGQTKSAAREPDKWVEQNPILGQHPSQRRIDAYFVAAGAAHAAVAAVLQPTWRHWWQYITIGIESGVVGNNYSMGISAQF